MSEVAKQSWAVRRGVELAQRAGVLEEIAKERKLQEAAGFTIARDDAQPRGTLTGAAACYLVVAADQVKKGSSGVERSLVRAGALIVAEIERLRRINAGGVA